jgi:hypothetical protein
MPVESLKAAMACIALPGRRQAQSVVDEATHPPVADWAVLIWMIGSLLSR